MRLEKLLGSKAKSDIIKYLVFKRQGISMRALENELEWTFPAIKKQVDMLEEASIVTVEKSDLRRAITLDEGFGPLIRQMYILSIKKDIKSTNEKYPNMIYQYFFGKIFGNEVELDLAIIHNNLGKETLDNIKNDIGSILKEYFVDNISLLFMSKQDFDNRTKVGDRFVINLLQKCKS